MKQDPRILEKKDHKTSQVSWLCTVRQPNNCSALYLFHDTCALVSQLRKRIQDDTQNQVEPNNGNEEEETQVKDDTPAIATPREVSLHANRTTQTQIITQTLKK